nr:hypothetical protein [Tanacetum cinerariifolium]
DDGHKLAVDIIGNQLLAHLLNRANAGGLDKNLVRDGRQAQNAPRRAVIVGFSQKQFAAAGQNQVVVVGGGQGVNKRVSE